MDKEKLIKEFCELTGIKKIVGYIRNLDTDEIRSYSNRSSLYRPPKGWVNIEVIILNKTSYPDLTSPINFIKLLNIQWSLFGEIGAQYVLQENETFQENYLYNRINAIKTCKSFGGGEMLNEYLETVKNTDFDNILEE